jgi:hypothetical protein
MGRSQRRFESMTSAESDNRVTLADGPRSDRLGLSFFFAHLLVSTYVLLGWTIPSPAALLFYMVLLPAIAAQWHMNRGCCVINNLESWLRSGCVRDPGNTEEGAFLLMLSNWLFRVRPHPVLLDRFSYTTVFALWLLAFLHLSWRAMA